MSAALILLAALAYGVRVDKGGFNFDGWNYVAHYVHGAHRSLIDDVLHHPTAPHRPGYELLAHLFYLAFGLHSRLYLLGGEVLLGAMALAAYLLLRILRFAWLDAAAIALLGWLFPFADSVHMVTIWAINSVGVTLFFLGAAAGLLAFRAGGWHARALHACSLILYVLSVLTYESALSAILLSFLLYRTQVTWPRAIRRGLIDIGAVALCAVFVTAHGAQAFPVLAIGAALRHAVTILVQGVGVLALAIRPPGSGAVTGATVIVSAIVAAFVVGAVAFGCARLMRSGTDRQRRVIIRWARVALAALVGLAVSWLLFVPAEVYYHPLGHADVNRMNVLAAFPIATWVYALARLAGTAASATWHGSETAARRVAILLTVALAAAYVQVLRADAGRWNEAIARSRFVLATVRHAIPRPPRNSLFLVEGIRERVGAGVLVFFESSEDLDAAVKVIYDDPSLDATRVKGRDTASGYVAASRRAVFLVDVQNDYVRRLGQPAAIAR